MDAIQYYKSNKPEMSMAYKIGLILFDIFGIPTTILGIAYNWGTVKGWALTCLSLLFICIRFAFYIDDKLAARKSRRIEREMRELDLQEKKDRHHNNHHNNNQNY